jgi:hypothetical protein
LVAALSVHSRHLTLLDTLLKAWLGLAALRHAARTLPTILAIAWCTDSSDSWAALNKMGCRSPLGLRLFLLFLLPYRVLRPWGIEVIGRNFKLGESLQTKKHTRERDQP